LRSSVKPNDGAGFLLAPQNYDIHPVPNPCGSGCYGGSGIVVLSGITAGRTRAASKKVR